MASAAEAKWHAPNRDTTALAGSPKTWHVRWTGFALLEQGCPDKYFAARGCTALGRALLAGRGTAKDRPRAVSVLRRACGGGPTHHTDKSNTDPEACDELTKLGESF